MKRALVCGAGGFIGAHLVSRLKREGFFVRGCDLKYPEFSKTDADQFYIGDLRSQDFVEHVIDTRFDEVYQLAADMGGAGYIFVGDNDADIMHNSATINLNILNICKKRNINKIFYSSSACIYPEYNQLDPSNPNCKEDTAYPANPDSEYGWEKLFSERLYLAYSRNFGIQCRIARYHNIFGPKGTWQGGKEKAPAALCRKVACADENGEIEVWGSGDQTRSFLIIDECIEGSIRLMRSNFEGPVNIGSDEMVSINQLAELIIAVSNKSIDIINTPGPLGVMGRNSQNDLIMEKIGWKPKQPLIDGLRETYEWIKTQVNNVPTS